jgi:hypothetical protein
MLVLVMIVMTLCLVRPLTVETHGLNKPRLQECDVTHSPPCWSPSFIDKDTLGIVTRGGPSEYVRSVVDGQMSALVSSLKTEFGIDRVQRIPDTLAVMIIFAISIELPLTEYAHRRWAYLHCSLTKLFDSVGKFTPVDVFLWVKPSSRLYVPQWLLATFPSVVVMTIPESVWELPPHTGNRSEWNMGASFSDDYFLMGRWRLTFALSFVREMGYDYMLQVDDDTFVLEDIAFNIVDHFREHNIVWGLRNLDFCESSEVTFGFPEFTK